MRRFLLQITGGILGIWIAVKFIPGAELKIIPGHSSIFDIALNANWQILLLTGSCLGLVNFLIKPLLQVITFPLRILTMGLTGLAINMAIVWLIDILFAELIIQGIIPLFWTTLVVWILNFLLLKAYSFHKR